MNRFAIIDIETTGGLYSTSKITEIAIIVYENKKIITEYETLINPECSIPYEITRITGISNDVVKDSPKFYEVAKTILDLTHNCIFVAHNVSFDYSFIKEEFRTLGFSYSRKRLCTVRLSKKYYPGLRSYSLENLIRHFEIEVKARHRAMEDARATLTIFEKMLTIEEEPERLQQLVKGMIQSTRLPTHLTMSEIDSLPEECGVYYMSDENGRYVYIGKSINIKDRILQHFNETSFKNNKMNRLVYSLAYKLTGSELMASLIESQEIKVHNPEINRAQKFKPETWALLYEKNDSGYYYYKAQNVTKINDKEIAINLFRNSKYANQYLEYLILEHNLCLTINQSKSIKNEACNRQQMGFCNGACIGLESREDYNERFLNNNARVNKFFTEDLVIVDKGRNPQENSFVLIENGFCVAIGYLDFDTPITSFEELKEQLEIYKGNIETNGIIQGFVKKNPKFKIIKLKK
ncbi:MAG: GIY-YIG nuclease family protein [Saprospiraceae bacterium]|nr:GIY-YIG nuclease family protein [Saprospiraceae bacterium]